MRAQWTRSNVIFSNQRAGIGFAYPNDWQPAVSVFMICAFSAYKVVLSVITQSYDTRFYNREKIKHELEQACTLEHFILCVITQVLHEPYNFMHRVKVFYCGNWLLLFDKYTQTGRRRDWAFEKLKFTQPTKKDVCRKSFQKIHFFRTFWAIFEESDIKVVSKSF